ncbi:triosephosphate isomerase [Candidatus Woesearchaeota archaeon]|nr:triosephosphate isomerase [Candidatus Woesearchaeota archaeon]
MKKPLIILNLKTYGSGTGRNAKNVAEICRKISEDIIIAAQATDIARISGKITTFSQHIDPVEQGKNTGFITAEAVQQAGAKGTLLNHAEHKLAIGEIMKSVTRARENKLVTVVCASNVVEAQEIAEKCSPDYIAIEPPELIGGNVSVSTANPKIITETIRAVNGIPVICGAGICSADDVKKALSLGAEGILVANFVMGAKDKKKAVSELVQGTRM